MDPERAINAVNFNRFNGSFDSLFEKAKPVAEEETPPAEDTGAAAITEDAEVDAAAVLEGGQDPVTCAWMKVRIGPNSTI